MPVGPLGGARGRWLASAFALWCLAALAAAADDAPPASPAGAPITESGATLFMRHCSHCHGFNMVTPGTIAPDLRRFPRDDRARFVTTVTHGRNNRMPPWADILSAEQIDALWDYVRSGGKM